MGIMYRLFPNYAVSAFPTNPPYSNIRLSRFSRFYTLDHLFVMIRAENSNISGFKRCQFVSKNAISTELEANCIDLTFNLSNLENSVSSNPRKSRTV